MKTVPALRATVLAAVLTGTLAACGQGAVDTGSTTTTTTASPTASARTGTPEQITPGGLAVIVRDHLGAQVEEFVTYEPEPGSVSVMVRLRDAGSKHNFGVSVYSPEGGTDFDLSARCNGDTPPSYGRKVSCRTLADGTLVMRAEMPGGFSDDNTDGMVLHAAAAPAMGGAAIAMYESYGDTAPVTAAQLEELVADPRLRWLTDAAVNDAGADVSIRKLDG